MIDPLIIELPATVSFDPEPDEFTTVPLSYQDSPLGRGDISIVRVTIDGLPVDLTPQSEEVLRVHLAQGQAVPA